ncbi:hypothetical protein MIMGU_mgv1a017440mg [Erythranthe guttata]|uniref:Uncharacterized protein n=1 Tax=Erythranthe guttata TaxID=4155 RepID=A0A022S208_ERYGU|nr:hypothetical protein MIMGU_mgv1a017440mg [Erythranthe guttata]
MDGKKRGQASTFTSYLFCVGFDLLGGTFRALEFILSYRLLSLSCKFLRDCEENECTIFGDVIGAFATRGLIASDS